MLLLAKTENIACIRKNGCELNYWSSLSKNRWDLYKINFNRSRVSMLSSSSVLCLQVAYFWCLLFIIDRLDILECVKTTRLRDLTEYESYVLT